MSWLRIDDSFIDHPKLVSLGPAAQRWAYLELLTYCAKHKTDGYFPAEISDTHRRLTLKFIGRCVEVGLVDQTAAGDLRIHDWEVYNPVKDVTGAVRQQRWRNAQRNGRVTDAVTANITDDVTSSRARLPSPTPTTQEPSFLPAVLDHAADADADSFERPAGWEQDLVAPAAEFRAVLDRSSE